MHCHPSFSRASLVIHDIYSRLNTHSVSGLYLTVIIIDILPVTYPEALHNLLFSAGMFMTVATTLWTTILIAYRIHSLSRHNIPNRVNHRFYRILEIILQSSMAYSVALVIYAVSLAIPQTNSNTFQFFLSGNIICDIAMTIAVFQGRYYLCRLYCLRELGYRTYHHGSASRPCIKIYLEY